MPRLCPCHGEVTGPGPGCTHVGCKLPLLELQGQDDEPKVWKWENRDSDEGDFGDIYEDAEKDLSDLSERLPA
jgi:hypothetical protein